MIKFELSSKIKILESVFWTMGLRAPVLKDFSDEIDGDLVNVIFFFGYIMKCVKT